MDFPNNFKSAPILVGHNHGDLPIGQIRLSEEVAALWAANQDSFSLVPSFGPQGELIEMSLVVIPKQPKLTFRSMHDTRDT